VGRAACQCTDNIDETLVYRRYHTLDSKHSLAYTHTVHVTLSADDLNNVM